MHRISILCPDGLVAFDLTAPAQVFMLAAKPGGEPLYEVAVCTPHGGPVCTTSGFEVSPSADAGALQRADTVVLPGYAGILEPPPEEALAAICAVARRGGRLMSV